MKFIIAIICTAASAFALSLFMPWWSIAIASFIVGFFLAQKNYVSFLVGFIALFLLWTILCLIISSGNNDLFSHKFSLLILQKDNPILLIIATGIIGGTVAGFAGLAGSMARKIFVKNS